MNQNSIQAHESIKPSKEFIHAKIVKALSIIGSGTFREIAHAFGLQDQQIWKRLSELERVGKIENVSDKICTVSGRSCSVWQNTNNN